VSRKTRTEIIVRQPTYDGAARTLKQLKRYANALADVRGVVPDKKPAAQLAASADAVEIISDTLRSLEAQVFDGPCAMNAAIEKRTKRNSKLRDAIDLFGSGHKRIEGDQGERIIAEGIAGLTIALALLMPTDALAQSRTFYGVDGKVTGRSATDSGGSTTFYDASGRIAGRSSTSGNQTTIYGSDGRRVGTVTTQQKREQWR
jgi:YD repeat-containing protein